MKLQTNIPFKAQAYDLIDFRSKILMLGSCFSENIGKKLNHFKLSAQVNPFGILFHPLAIEQFIVNAINKKEYSANDVFFHNERWHSFEAHSSLSQSSQEELISLLNDRSQTSLKEINSATHLIITLGTAWAYRFLETDNFVANCHKIPQKKFSKEILPVNKISESLAAIIALVKSVNPKIAILFTLSPVRHLKDGFIENSQSKAHLLAAVHQVIDQRNKMYYFPSYELMMDELRDYRFYEEDMIHPNQTAINYIWQKFKDVWIDPKIDKTLQQVDDVQKSLAHKVNDPNSIAYRDFKTNLQATILSIQAAHPSIKF